MAEPGKTTTAVNMDLAHFLGVNVRNLLEIRIPGELPSTILMRFLGGTEGASVTNLRDTNGDIRAHLGEGNDTVLVLLYDSAKQIVPITVFGEIKSLTLRAEDFEVILSVEADKRTLSSNRVLGHQQICLSLKQDDTLLNLPPAKFITP